MDHIIVLAKQFLSFFSNISDNGLHFALADPQCLASESGEDTKRKKINKGKREHDPPHTEENPCNNEQNSVRAATVTHETGTNLPL